MLTSLALHAMVALLPLLHAVDATLSRTSARHALAVSSKGKGSGTARAARESFNTGCSPRDGLDLAAAGRADARRHARVGRRGDVPRASAARSNEGGCVLADELHVGVGSAVNFLNPTVSEWHQYPMHAHAHK